MLSRNIAIDAEGLGKTYWIYAHPLDRLKQIFAGKRKHYGRAFHALSDISFKLSQGQVLGLVGNNGAGKSTLLQLVCNTLKPSNGSIKVKGRVAALLELGAGFNPEFSGRENIYLNASVLGLSREETEHRLEGIIDFSGVRDFIDQPVKTYSSGMYVRLAFSIATSVDPDILIIDEALSVGDGAFARKSFDRIMELKDRGATILFCSHSMFQIESLCDSVLWLERGRIRMQGAPHDVARAYLAEISAGTPQVVLAHTRQEVVPATHLSGRGHLTSIDASVDGVTGTELTLQSKVSTLKVDVAFQYDVTLPTPTVAFTVENEAGVIISSGGTLLQAVVPDLRPGGIGRTTLILPHLPLMHGKFFVSVYLACERTIHIYDHAPRCIALHVWQDSIEQGIVHIPYNWVGMSAQ